MSNLLGVFLYLFFIQVKASGVSILCISFREDINSSGLRVRISKSEKIFHNLEDCTHRKVLLNLGVFIFLSN
jgi:hypothetical protein